MPLQADRLSALQSPAPRGGWLEISWQAGRLPALHQICQPPQLTVAVCGAAGRLPALHQICQPAEADRRRLWRCGQIARAASDMPTRRS